MGNPAAKYKVIGVVGAGTVEGTCAGAPTESWMCSWGKKRHCRAVIRYFPSKRGWRVLDIRNAFEVQTADRRNKWWRGAVRSSIYFPNEDAAVMAALHLLD